MGGKNIQVALAQRVDHCCFAPVEKVSSELENLHQGEICVNGQSAE